ncbi:hypothetical protein FB567DRAFT_579198 [Paraphoma chrysanthemicola]|uniref:Uncharacterized protein n=1 Tax=Paraphoma chrysanthemicola TaxID=798071 RepID=A0A8K0VZP2_9PLEO|nr:hypothetical protein FB567DRAFT_579198 [Paraphoma chrysanthemicola]
MKLQDAMVSMLHNIPVGSSTALTRFMDPAQNFRLIQSFIDPGNTDKLVITKRGNKIIVGIVTEHVAEECFEFDSRPFHGRSRLGKRATTRASDRKRRMSRIHNKCSIPFLIVDPIEERTVPRGARRLGLRNPGPSPQSFDWSQSVQRTPVKFVDELGGPPRTPADHPHIIDLSSVSPSRGRSPAGFDFSLEDAVVTMLFHHAPEVLHALLDLSSDWFRYEQRWKDGSGHTGNNIGRFAILRNNSEVIVEQDGPTSQAFTFTHSEVRYHGMWNGRGIRPT